MEVEGQPRIRLHHIVEAGRLAVQVGERHHAPERAGARPSYILRNHLRHAHVQDTVQKGLLEPQPSTWAVFPTPGLGYTLTLLYTEPTHMRDAPPGIIPYLLNVECEC